MNNHYNAKAWADYLKTFDLEDTISSLDQVLFDAVMHYLDNDSGGVSNKTAEDVQNVRFLLEALRECKG